MAIKNLVDKKLSYIINSRKGKFNSNFNLNNDENRSGSYREWAKLYMSSYGFTCDEYMRPKELSWEEIYRDQKMYYNVWLAHMIRDEKSLAYHSNFESLISNWDIISCSLLNFNSIKEGSLFGSVGFLLSVPPQNIIGAHSDDLWFPNHIGSNYKKFPLGADRAFRAGLLAQSLLTNVNLQGPLEQIKRYRNVKMTRVLPPLELLQKNMKYSKHNEVLVVGRRNINIYNDKPSTSNIIVRAIIISPIQQEIYKFTNLNYYYKDIAKRALKLRDKNPSLPILVAKGMAMNWKWGFLGKYRRASDQFI
ncbi:hypothetical protein KCX83_12880 [Brucella oryzae]|uniref:hypothetical protein n=1 Tax=Brucella oryzae TaxID=335286 RepID=UPI001B839854|nr:hypothetical protein [Brucella oryzae]MBR7653217.1 hypothetical protein [Brucella oryzae]